MQLLFFWASKPNSRGLLRRYELHHGVRISDSALVDAAVLSDRYIADRFLPDKAIDLVSGVCRISPFDTLNGASHWETA